MAETVYCTNCGNGIDTDVDYCPNCGESQSPEKDDMSGSDDGFGEEFYSEKTPTERAEESASASARSFLYEDDEEVVSVLGENYIGSVLGEGSFSKSVMILSNSRLYQKGVRYHGGDVSSGGKFMKKKGSKVVSVSDITGTSFDKMVPMGKILGIFFAILAVFGLIAAGVQEGGGVVFSIGCLFALAGGFVAYKINENKLFVVEYAGGQIGTQIKWYGDESVEEFRRKLFLLKED